MIQKTPDPLDQSALVTRHSLEHLDRPHCSAKAGAVPSDVVLSMVQRFDQRAEVPVFVVRDELKNLASSGNVAGVGVDGWVVGNHGVDEVKYGHDTTSKQLGVELYDIPESRDNVLVDALTAAAVVLVQTHLKPMIDCADVQSDNVMSTLENIADHVSGVAFAVLL